MSTSPNLQAWIDPLDLAEQLGMDGSASTKTSRVELALELLDIRPSDGRAVLAQVNVWVDDDALVDEHGEPLYRLSLAVAPEVVEEVRAWLLSTAPSWLTRERLIDCTVH